MSSNLTLYLHIVDNFFDSCVDFSILKVVGEECSEGDVQVQHLFGEFRATVAAVVRQNEIQI